MTPQDQLLTERDRLLEAIVVERVQAELPGDTDVQRFARSITASALLGHTLPMETVVAAPALSSTPISDFPEIPISPDPPVEVAIPRPEEREPSVGEVPGARLTGETEGDANPPPDEPGSAAAIFKARQYVLLCIERQQPIYPTTVTDLTGMERNAVQSFISDLQDEARQRGSEKAHRDAETRALLSTAEDDDEPDSELPEWWSDEIAIQCGNPDCGKVIAPQKRKTRWEHLNQYRLRRYCCFECGQARYEKNGKKVAA
jgi:hypothetical protein